MTISRPWCWTIYRKSFFILSLCEPLVFLKTPSVRRPCISLCCVWLYFRLNLCKIKHPTSSHTSAPSKAPIVTSNKLSPFFTQHSLLSYSSAVVDFLFFGDFCDFLSESDWVRQKLLADWRVEVFDVECHEFRLLFVVDELELQKCFSISC